MRSILALLLFLFLTAWIAAVVELPDSSAQENIRSETTFQQSNWRHTANGWRRIDDWAILPDGTPKYSSGLAVHPMLVALMQLLVILAVLVYFTPEISDSKSPGAALSRRRDRAQKIAHPAMANRRLASR